MARGWRGIRVAIPSDARYLGPVRAVIRAAAAFAGFDRDSSSEIELAVTEGCSNVIRHCYGNCDNERIDLVLTLDTDALEIRIDDYGKFVDPSRIKSRALDDVRPGGLGVHLMHKLMDEVIYKRNQWGGTSLTLRKRLAGAAEKTAEDRRQA